MKGNDPGKQQLAVKAGRRKGGKNRL